MPQEKFSDTEKTMTVVLDYYYNKFLKVDAKPFVTGQDLIDCGLALDRGLGRFLKRSRNTRQREQSRIGKRRWSI